MEPMHGMDDLAAVVADFGPAPHRRLGVLVDHLVDGSKETRAGARRGRAGTCSSPAIPFVDVWQAVKPSVVGIRAWPAVPRGTDWKTGVCAALGWGEPADGGAAGAGRGAQLPGPGDAADRRGGAADRLRDRRRRGMSTRTDLPVEQASAGVLAGSGHDRGRWCWLVVGLVLVAAELRRASSCCSCSAEARCVAAGASLVARRPCGGRSWCSRVASVLLLLGLRPALRRRLTAACRTRPRAPRRSVGGTATVVLTRVDGHGGRVRIGGDDWSARVASTGHTVIEPGSRSPSCEIAGATALVLVTIITPGSGGGQRGRGTVLLVIVLLFVLLVIVSVVKAVQIIPQAQAAVIERLGRYQKHPDARAGVPGAVHRPHPGPHRPARAGGVVPAAAGDHRRTT